VSDSLAVAGLVVGIIGGAAGLVAAVSSIWAALLTKKGNEAAELDRKASAAQRRADLMPRPEINGATGLPDRVSLHVSNPGNTATLWHVLIVVGNSLYYLKTSVSAGCIGVMTSGGDRIKELAETLPAGQFMILASLARDLDGTLWDLQTGEVEERTAAEALNEQGALYDLKFR
jgi:hypothetical protein